MQEQFTPRLSSAKENLKRRKLDFEKKFESEPRFPADKAIPKVPEPKMEKDNHGGVGTGAGVTSRIETPQMLFSSPLTPNNGCGRSWLPGGSWSDARPF